MLQCWTAWPRRWACTRTTIRRSRCWSKPPARRRWRGRSRTPSGESGQRPVAKKAARAAIDPGGRAGWSLPRAVQDAFGEGEATSPLRHALRGDRDQLLLPPPAPARAVREWAAAVPPAFRFCAKLPRTITHERRLVDCEPAGRVPAQASGLGDKLACLLVQLPPSFASMRVAAFLARLVARFAGAVALEPRHASWFTPQAEALLRTRKWPGCSPIPCGTSRPLAGRMAATGVPALHGSPRMYYSSYETPLLQALADRMLQARPGAKSGASSTTPHRARPPPTRSSCCAC